MKKLFLFILIIFFSGALRAEPPKQIVFFGDSLTDNGNLFRALFKIMPKSPPYYNGRFSNGLAWADSIEKFYLQKYNVPTVNYAVGGATAVLRSPFEGFLPYNVMQEMNTYFATFPFSKKDQVLFFLWIGGNDYLNGSKNVDADALRVVTEIQNVLEKLFHKGARHFVILNLPDLAKTPYAVKMGLTTNLHELTLAHNKKLSDMLKNFKSIHPDAQIHPFDIFTLYEDINAHPEKYNEKYHLNLKEFKEACWTGGYTLNQNDKKELEQTLRLSLAAKGNNSNPVNLTEAILQSPALSEAYRSAKAYERGETPCAHPEEYLFWDFVHPTAVVHDLLSKIMIENLMSASK